MDKQSNLLHVTFFIVSYTVQAAIVIKALLEETVSDMINIFLQRKEKVGDESIS